MERKIVKKNKFLVGCSDKCARDATKRHTHTNAIKGWNCRKKCAVAGCTYQFYWNCRLKQKNNA